jgi:deazaflavin-dependent oxidoreductase (nitroreductase family)
MNQWLPASRVGARLFSHTLHHVDRILMGLSKGRLSIPGVMTGLPVVMLTTTGAKSNLPRTVPVVGMRDGEKVILIASNWGSSRHPAWYLNLRAHPDAAIDIGRRRETYVARPATDPERDQYWQRATTVYRGFAAYARRTRGRQIPIMVLTPKRMGSPARRS